MNYRLGMTLSYFNEDTNNLEQDYLADMRERYQAYEIDELIAEVVEEDDDHISGVIGIQFVSENNDTAKEYVANFIRENDLGGECWTLTDKDMTKEIATDME